MQIYNYIYCRYIGISMYFQSLSLTKLVCLIDQSIPQLLYEQSFYLTFTVQFKPSLTISAKSRNSNMLETLSCAPRTSLFTVYSRFPLSLASICIASLLCQSAPSARPSVRPS